MIELLVVLAIVLAALETLGWHDAATATRYIKRLAHRAFALLTQSYRRPGQFAVYNALGGPTQLFVLTAGHRPYHQGQEESLHMLREIYDFFIQFDPDALPVFREDEPGLLQLVELAA